MICTLRCLLTVPFRTTREDRQDDYAERAKYKERAALVPKDIAEVMLKVIESKDYDGGTCVLKTPHEERVQEEGHLKSKAEAKYDPSPRPDPDIGRIKQVLAEERGKKWAVPEEKSGVLPLTDA